MSGNGGGRVEGVGVGVWGRGVGGVTGFHKHRMEVGNSKLSWDLNGRLGVAGEGGGGTADRCLPLFTYGQ